VKLVGVRLAVVSNSVSTSLNITGIKKVEDVHRKLQVSLINGADAEDEDEFCQSSSNGVQAALSLLPLPPKTH
jgi:hypothetical protein